MGETARSARQGCCLLLLGVMLGGCAGPDTHIRPPTRGEPLPIVTRGGPAVAGDAHKALARALHGAEGIAQDHTLVEAVRGATVHAALVAGNRATLLSDGPSTFAAFARAILDARHHILVETFIFSDDHLGRAFAALLAAKSRAGVEVRVLYDSVGSWGADDAVFQRMREAGVQVRAYRPWTEVGKVLNGDFNRRDHRKLLVVDGRVAFVGGVNISGTYNLGSGFGSSAEGGLADGWRDTQVRISGPVVQQFQALFFATWARAAPDAAREVDGYFPPLREQGGAIVAAVASEHGAPNEAAIHRVLLAAANAARARLWITQAYFAPDRALRDALVHAARRGVDVRVLVPGFSDSQAVLRLSRALYGEILAAGGRVFEYERAFVHAKTMVVDDSVSFVGSANMDYRSAVDNNELTAVVIEADFAARLAAVFQRDLTGAREVTLARWRARPLRERVLERAAALLWGWL